MSDFRCPRCRTSLTAQKTQSGVVRVCQGCQGRAIAVAVVRKQLDPAAVRELWRTASEGLSVRGAKCPICSRTMDEVAFPLAATSIKIDVCRPCQHLWFDRSELEQLPQRQVEQRELSPEAKRAVAEFEIERIRQEAQLAEDERDTPLERFLRNLLFWVPLD